MKRLPKTETQKAKGKRQKTNPKTMTLDDANQFADDSRRRGACRFTASSARFKPNVCGKSFSAVLQNLDEHSFKETLPPDLLQTAKARHALSGDSGNSFSAGKFEPRRIRNGAQPRAPASYFRRIFLGFVRPAIKTRRARERAERRDYRN